MGEISRKNIHTNKFVCFQTMMEGEREREEEKRKGRNEREIRRRGSLKGQVLEQVKQELDEREKSVFVLEKVTSNHRNGERKNTSWTEPEQVQNSMREDYS